jgi:phage regulator Rha-like protein
MSSRADENANVGRSLVIHVIRGHRVVLDSELAQAFGVETKAFNQTIRRNSKNFPADFAFKLTYQELANLRSQSVTSSLAHGGRRHPPFVFTEHGVIMAAALLRSDRAIAMSVYVVRAFIRMREELATSAAILKRLAEIDEKLLRHDVALRDVYAKLLPLLQPLPEPPRRQIGFHRETP